MPESTSFRGNIVKNFIRGAQPLFVLYPTGKRSTPYHTTHLSFDRQSVPTEPMHKNLAEFGLFLHVLLEYSAVHRVEVCCPRLPCFGCAGVQARWGEMGE